MFNSNNSALNLDSISTRLQTLFGSEACNKKECDEINLDIIQYSSTQINQSPYESIQINLNQYESMQIKLHAYKSLIVISS